MRSTALKRCKGKLAPPVEYRSEIGSKARNNARQLVDKIRSSRKERKKPLFSGQFFYMSVAPDQMPMVKGVKHLLSQRAASLHSSRQPFFTLFLANPQMQEETQS